MSLKTLEKEQAFHLPIYKRFPLVISKGQGCTVFDENGKEYLDALAGIAVNNLGHCHPAVVSAIQNQAQTLMHVSNLYYTQPQSDLAEALVNRSGLDRVFFCNSGAEANEAAVKFARNYAEKKGRSGAIVSFTQCFHGRTLSTIAMGKKQYQKGFDPMPGGFEQWTLNDIESLEKGFKSNPPIAIFLEPIQGEGGVNPVESDFAQRLQNLCNENDTLLICDEIQSGFGRTGKFFAFEHFGLQPDMVAMAKGMGGGMPIGGVLLNQKVADQLEAGQHGTTFGGNPLACAAALAVVQNLTNELIAEAATKGSKLIEALQTGLAQNKKTIEIRGLGLMIGIELNESVKPIVADLMDHGFLVGAAGENVIRLVPPLVISKEEIERLAQALITAIEK